MKTFIAFLFLVLVAGLFCSCVIQHKPEHVSKAEQKPLSNTNLKSMESANSMEIWKADSGNNINTDGNIRLTNKRGRVYSVSGIGFGFTSGQTGVLLQPKFSTNLGFDISVGRGNLFIYPSIDFLTFRYDQQIADADYLYSSHKSRASYTILTLAFGYRKSFGNMSFYPFAGIGGGTIAEPRISVNNSNQQTTLTRRRSSTLSAKGGLGLEYRIGQFVVFTEGNFLHNLTSLQERKVNVLPVYVGLKSNISSVFTNRKEN